jgi:hypothetical protein
MDRNEELDQLKKEILAIAGSKKALIRLKRHMDEEDAQLQKELLALAKSGAPRPKKGTRLGDALIRFTTPPAKRTTSAKRMKLSEVDRLQVAAQKASEKEMNRGRAIPRQRPRS